VCSDNSRLWDSNLYWSFFITESTFFLCVKFHNVRLMFSSPLHFDVTHTSLTALFRGHLKGLQLLWESRHCHCFKNPHVHYCFHKSQSLTLSITSTVQCPTSLPSSSLSQDTVFPAVLYIKHKSNFVTRNIFITTKIGKGLRQSPTSHHRHPGSIPGH
jgi:hypothetical protein